VVPGSVGDGETVSALLGVKPWFTLEMRHGEPASTSVSREQPVVAVAGIARPERFFAALVRDGWDVAERIASPDHHWFTPGDVERVDMAARTVRAAAVLTTDKDMARLAESPLAPPRVPWVAVPLHASIEPADQFREWLRQRLTAARAPEMAGT
jgi:tetraacyldisaccharide-1-P 4'-kinase